ncbi:protein kinase domain-containing protein [Pseudoduganella sp. RAF53_2]|uniref:protein kinase domain-containing protein n=1 Tax=unclassified Pseudoduganella TaxID=2637179 RepID=UPI003F9B29CF
MPALDISVIKDITQRLERYLTAKGGYTAVEYLTSGGSAAIFKVDGPEGGRAFKVFDPRFFEGKVGEAERRRLDVQRRLIGHECHSLVRTFRVEEAEGTAVMEMEFVTWPDLNKVLEEVPDVEVSNLIRQLVVAAKFLEDQGIVHRDIKPENIKISADFKSLKLLDLGVARNIESADDVDAAVTDHGNLRPFLATAQYSSPEYLFRLDEPAPKLWKGLNFYQIGAVLHDLIMKKQLFDYEMKAGNRWLVSKAVLTKMPSFAEGNASRLRALKALAARCLTKDLDLRLQIVGWEDFMQEDTDDPMNALRGRLARSGMTAGPQSKAAADARLEFERNDFAKTLHDNIRNELIAVCGTTLPNRTKVSADRLSYTYIFEPGNGAVIQCQLNLDWQGGVFARDARIEIAAVLCHERQSAAIQMPPMKSLCQATIDGTDDTTVNNITGVIARAVGAALDIVDAMDDIDTLESKNLLDI